ncbi:MAG: putative zinc-binding protein, partial [Candidatus Bathyarchaeia archaeon]
MSDEAKVAVVACAGMDKALGTVAMFSVFKLTEELRPKETKLIALPPLLAGVTLYSELVAKLPVIVVDGCAERCATKLVAKSGGRIRG